MIGFSRFTAIIFMLLGVALLVAGGAIALGGLIRLPVSAPSAPSLMPDLSVFSVFAGALAGGIVAFQGLVLAAVGQVLWLMASMVQKTQLSIEYLAEAVNRLGNVKVDRG